MNHSERAALERERELEHGWGAVRADRWDAVVTHARPLVLDVGCSSGGYVERLTSSGISAVGLDVLPHEGWKVGGGRYVCGEGGALPIRSRAAQALLAFETLEHIRDPEPVLREWCRVTADTILISVPQTRSPGWAATAGLDFHHNVDRTHVNFFDEDSLAELLSRVGFEVVELRPILPIQPFVPALAALGLPERVAEGVGRRLRWMVRRAVYSGLLAVARRP